MKNKLVHGHGINDADYVVSWVKDGKRDKCPYYQKWRDMLKRCYSSKFHEISPTYKDCTVSDEWLSFMTFREWMMEQNWEGLQLDKDILFPDNKHYSPETCRFVTPQINSFLLDCEKSRGNYFIGVYWDKHAKKFQSKIRYNGKRIYLGYYNTEIEAHNAWKDHKLMQYDELIDDPENEYIREGLISHRNRLIVEH